MSDADPRLSRRDAERLLDAPAEHDSALGWALTAASAPGSAAELQREDAAVAAFHAARVTPVAARPRTTSGRRAATRAVVATGAVVALTTGGLALADVVDLPLLPGPANERASESVSKSPGRSVTSSGATTTTGSPAQGASSGGRSTSGSQGPSSPGSTSRSPSSQASPTPSYEGLCKAYQATDRGGKSLDSTAFQALAAEAGGSDNIATYCVALIGPPKETGRPTDKPSPTKPTKPTKTPNPHQPTKTPNPNQPTDRPTDKPTDRPTDGPGNTETPGTSGNNGSSGSSGSSQSSGNAGNGGTGGNDN